MFARPLAILGCGLAASAAASAWRTDPEVLAADAAGAALLARLQCTACHAASAEVEARLRPLGAPDLAGVGARVSADGFRDWLDGAHLGARASRMPDLLHGLAPAERAEAIEDLTHFLAELGGPFLPHAARADAWRPDEGARLMSRLACAACHAEEEWEARGLARRTDLPTLAAFLADPHATRPAGGMPDFGLTRAEAEAIASHLLRAQHEAGPARHESLPGVAWSYHEYPLEGPFPADLGEIPETAPVREGVAELVGLQEGHRPERFLFRFEGWIECEEKERVTFGLVSDDGSILYVDDEKVVDNDGHHAPQEKRGSATLAPGLHRIRIEMFEAGGGETLEAWIERGGRRRPLGAEDLNVRAPVHVPVGWAPFAPDPARAARGLQRFGALGCGNCHGGVAPPPERAAPALDALDPRRGCLADQPPASSARYALDPEQREALRAALAGFADLRRPASPAAAVAAAARRLDCVACHARAGAGRPATAITAAFGGDGDLGDEGRVPPTLDGVGAKLTRDALERVLAGEGAVRPYLHARMPRFAPAQVEGLAAAFDEADWRNGEDAPPAFDASLVEAGRSLGGTGGLNCAQCHPVAGNAASGVQSMDLARMAERLDWAWFRSWLSNPLAMRPGTRMPVFFAGGRSAARHVLDGDMERQIAALWAWISLGDSMPLPDGVQLEAGAFALVPAARPIYFGAFQEGGSPRVLNVGFPERVHLAFDFGHARLMQVWRGDFMDAEGTWFGRAGALESPAGDDVRALPPGSAFARLAAPDAPWPPDSDRASGWRVLGHRRDARERPIFRYAHGGFRVEESLQPEYAAGGAVLVRRFAVDAPAGESWTLRAGLAGAWTRGSDGAWRSDDGWTLRVAGAEARVRATAAGAELLAPVPPGGGAIEVRMAW